MRFNRMYMLIFFIGAVLLLSLGVFIRTIRTTKEVGKVADSVDIFSKQGQIVDSIRTLPIVRGTSTHPDNSSDLPSLNPTNPEQKSIENQYLLDNLIPVTTVVQTPNSQSILGESQESTPTKQPICTDSDKDSFSIEGAQCGRIDCDDRDQSVHPDAKEICDNGIDDDCDNKIDIDCERCTDSDEGINYQVAGNVWSTDANGSSTTLVDACGTGASAGSLTEFYCIGVSSASKQFLCPIGCSDGACLVENSTCTDSDGDQFAVEGGVCGQVDCKDVDPMVNPGMGENCHNGIDDNCNGSIDMQDPQCSAPPNLIIIGWDGMQYDHFMQCYRGELTQCENGLPYIQALSGGKIYNSTITDGGTATKPGWAQILTGYNAEVTGVFSNGDYKPIPAGYTVFEKIENHFGAQNVVTMFISGKDVHTGGACVGDATYKGGLSVVEDLGQPWCLTKNHLDYYENDLRQNEVVGARALELLQMHKNDFFFSLFLFREPDVTGHLAGENSFQYSEQIVELDSWLGIIEDKLRELNLYDRTLIYLTTDHGFDEGSDKHSNAPFGIFASNDPLIIRSGDRKDITPTILQRYGISQGGIGGAPAVDGYSLYNVLPYNCVPEGEAYYDYSGAPGCCSGLSLIGLDKKSGKCIPPTGGTDVISGYCTACGNGVCETPENKCNCPEDCSS